MHLEHSFSVTAGVADTWRAMLDPERMAKCIPGAALDSVKNGVASGAIRVRFGAIGPTYRGTAQVVDKDDEGHRAIVEAQGGTRAHGEATVRMIVTLSPFGDSTNVMLQSDVRLTGRTAELDSQVISDAGDRLCRQVAARLNDLLTTAPRREQPSPAPADETPVVDPAAAVDEPTAADEPTATEEPVATEEPTATEPPPPKPARRPSPYPRPAEDSPDRPSSPPADSVAPSARDSVSAGPDTVRKLAPALLVLAILLLLRRRRRRRRR